MSSPVRDRSNAENPTLGTRLNCWKEIASHLGKVERTVKRWELDRGLPIHRVPGGGRASVFAYTAELDEWLNSRKALEPEAFPHEVEEPEIEDSSLPLPSPLPPGEAIATTNPAPAPPAPAATRFPRNRTSLLAYCAALLLAVLGPTLYPPARNAVAALSAKLGSPSAKRAAKTSQPAVAVSDVDRRQARDLYLQGRYEWNQRTPDSLNRALDDFTQAIVHDPGYAPAYAGMADTYNLQRQYSTLSDSQAYAHAIAAARKAVELDDSLSEAHRALAFAEWWGQWDFVDGEKEFRRAIELNPRDSVARMWYANVLSVQRRFPEALEQIDRAQELDPSSHSILADKGLLLFNAGKSAEAIDLLREVERSAPDYLSPHEYLMSIGLARRDYPMYLDEAKKAAGNDAVLRDIVAAAQTGYDQDGARGFLTHLAARQQEYYAAGKIWGSSLAETYAIMGRKQEALQLLEDAYNRHEWIVLGCITNPDLITLRDEPRYQALIRKINFPQAAPLAQPPALPNAHQPPLTASSVPH